MLRLAGLGTPRGKHDPPLPSWVVHCHSDPMDHLFLWLYQACQKDWILSMAAFEVWPLPYPTLTVPGIQIDTVLCTRTLDVPEMVSIGRADPLSLWRHHFKTYPTGCDPNHAWVRTITADVNGGSVGPKRLGEQKVLQYDCISKLDREEDPPLVEISKAFPKNGMDVDERLRKFMIVKAEYDKALLAALRAGRNRLSSSRRRVTWESVPRALEEGDAICIILGCNIPLLLREKEDHHLLVGESFVWGLMDGEAFDGKEEKCKTVTFRLR